ncbi:MAG: anti-sigma factor antagonist [Christensenellales bacterium]|mgnify:CR=1 FL=1|jgi:stage II sporulation protein AA (anti-sigma F factor antagonist)|nr:anti-sigma factor antagonist [Clostridiales bacterium]
MLVNSEIVGDNLYIFLNGELDHSVAEIVKKEMDKSISQANVKNVILNLRYLNFMDSAGIGLIMSCYKKFKKYSIKLFFDQPSSAIDKVLKVSGLYSIIPVI